MILGSWIRWRLRRGRWGRRACSGPCSRRFRARLGSHGLPLREMPGCGMLRPRRWMWMRFLGALAVGGEMMDQLVQ